MDIILVKPVKNLGKIGEIIKVKGGFSRYLRREGLAITATADNKRLIEQQKHELEDKNSHIKQEAEKLADVINGRDLIFIRQATDDKKLFGSISAKEIASALSTDVVIKHSNIVIESIIKSVGIFTIEVALHPEVSANIRIIVARSESEAQDLLKTTQHDSTELQVNENYI